MIRNVFAFLSRVFSFLWSGREQRRTRGPVTPLTPIYEPKPARHVGRWPNMFRRSLQGPRCRCSEHNAFCKRHRVYVFNGVPDREIVARRVSFVPTRKERYAKNQSSAHSQQQDAQRSVKAVGQELVSDMQRVQVATASA